MAFIFQDHATFENVIGQLQKLTKEVLAVEDGVTLRVGLKRGDYVKVFDRKQPTHIENFYERKDKVTVCFFSPPEKDESTNVSKKLNTVDSKKITKPGESQISPESRVNENSQPSQEAEQSPDSYDSGESQGSPPSESQEQPPSRLIIKRLPTNNDTCFVKQLTL